MGWIDRIANSINGLMEKQKKPAAKIDNMLMLCEAKRRSGLSAIRLCSRIIKRLPEAGIPTGPNPDGSPNLILKFVRVFSEEFVTKFKDDAVANNMAEAFMIAFNAASGNAGGPAALTGQNTNLFEYEGVPQ